MDFKYLEFEPPPALQPILSRSFFARGRIPYRSDKILPNGLAVVIFNMGAPHRLGKSESVEENLVFAHSWLHGVQTTPIFNTPSAETHVLGLLFEPIGLHALFGVDMRTLVDRTVDARAVLPLDAVRVLESILPTAAKAEAHRSIHEAFLGRDTLTLQPWLSELYRTIKSTRGNLNLGEVYGAIGCSPRHINARFKKAVGVNPKVFCRIHRLHALLGEIDPEKPVSWTELAHRLEFYDQAHINREFRKFSGLHPRQYLAARMRDLPQLAKGESVSFAPQQ